MGKMSDLVYDIQELFIEGYLAHEIAVQLGCSVVMVRACLHEFGVEAEDINVKEY